MKKWFIPGGILIVLAAIAFIPVRQTYQLSISSSYYSVYQNLTSVKGWAKWNPDFAEAGLKTDSISVNNFSVKSSSSTVNLHVIGLGAFDIKVSGGSGAGQYDCVITTTDTANLTRALVTHRSRLAGYLLAMAKSDTNTSFIYKLKNYLEDTRTHYGFLIQKQNTHDQFYIVKVNKLPVDSVCAVNVKALEDLRDAAAKLKLNTPGELCLQYISTINDTAELILGLAIKKEGPTNSSVTYMQMPGSKIIAGSFKGRYKDRQKLYSALYLYMADRNLHQQIKPYETFLNNQLPANDETIVDMHVIVPYV